MRFRHIVLLTLALLVIPSMASASTILINTSGTLTLGGSGFEGHSFTTPGGTAYNNITWSWISSDQVTLLAAGNLFLLTQEYLGTPNGLTSSTPGFVAQSTGIASSAYVFASGVTLSPSTQYWVYMGGASSLAGGGFTFSNPFAGGQAYEQFQSPNLNYFYNGATLDFNFVLSGTATAAPEPSTWLLLGTGLAAVVARLQYKKRA
jgi:hypothetical protein